MPEKPTNNTIQAFWVGMGSLSSFALAIVSAAILSRYFDKTEYGTYRQILYVYGTLHTIFAAGLPKVFSYYLPRYDLAHGKDIVKKISRLLFLMGLLFSLFLFCFSGVIAVILKNPELSVGLKWFSPIPMLLLPTLGIEGIFSSYKKTLYIAIYHTASRLLTLLFIVIPVVLFNGTYINAIFGWIIVSVITFIFAYYFKGIPFVGILAKKVELTYKEVFSYSLPILIASIAGIAISSADQFFISRYFGAEVFAEYANGFIQIPFVLMITAAASTVLSPEFSRIFHTSDNTSKAVELWRSALIKSAILIYPLVIFFIVYASQIMILLFSSLYENSIIYFRIAMFMNFFNIIIFAPLMLASGNVIIYRNIHIIIAIFVWLSEYFAVLLFKTPISVAITSVSLGIFKILILTWYSSRIIKVNFFSLIPIKIIATIIIHSVIVISFVKYFSDTTLYNYSQITVLVVVFISFSFLLLVSARFFKLDYLMPLQPVYEIYARKRKKVT